MADIPLASLAEDIPIEGTFNIINHNTGQPAGRIQASITWHDPLVMTTMQGVAPRSPLLDPCSAGLPFKAGHSDGNEPWPQHHQPLSAVLLPLAAIEGAPSINAAAAAAVSAVLNSKKRQELPLLAVTQATDPAVAFQRQQDDPVSGRPIGQMQLPTGQRLASMPSSNLARLCGNNQQIRCTDATKVLQIGPCISQAAVSRAKPAGCTSTDLQSSAPVMRRVDPNPASWEDLDTTIYFKIESLSLSADALDDTALQHLLLAHMFCEDFTSAAQQCTGTIPKG